MNTEEIKNKLVALEANLDAVLFRRMYEEENGAESALKAGAAAGALGAAGYGGYRADKAIMAKYGQRAFLGTGPITPGSPRSIAMRTATAGDGSAVGVGKLGRLDAYKTAASDVGQTISNRARHGWTVGKNVYARGAEEVGKTINPLTRLLRAGKVGLRIASGGKIRL